MRIAAVSLSLLIVPAISLAQQVAIGEYRVYTQTQPAQIVLGPDGALWFTGLGSAAEGSIIGRIPASGATFTQWTVPYTGYQYAITPGPDGALWFTEGSTGNIGRITTTFEISQFPLPTPGTQTSGITSGPDGALWFTEGNANKIGRITTTGSVTEYGVPFAGNPGWIAAGPDGALWFTEFNNGGSQIGRVTTAGSFTMYATPEGTEPYQIVTGPDGALWFTDGTGIGSITTSGVATQYNLPPGGSPQGIASGPEGDLWFTEETGNQLGRITTAGKITQYAIPTSGSNPIGIAAGPKGTLWFCEYTGNKIGEAFLVTADLSVSPATGFYSSELTFTGSGFAPNEEVVVYQYGYGSPACAGGAADSTGSFTGMGLEAGYAYGPRILVGLGQTSGKVGAADFSVTPRVIPTPDSGTQGSAVTVAAWGFGAYESVQLFWNTPRTRLGTEAADINGYVTFNVTVPDGAPTGKNGVFGRGESTNAIGSGSFDVK